LESWYLSICHVIKHICTDTIVRLSFVDSSFVCLMSQIKRLVFFFSDDHLTQRTKAEIVLTLTPRDGSYSQAIVWNIIQFCDVKDLELNPELPAVSLAREEGGLVSVDITSIVPLGFRTVLTGAANSVPRWTNPERRISSDDPYSIEIRNETPIPQTFFLCTTYGVPIARLDPIRPESNIELHPLLRLDAFTTTQRSLSPTQLLPQSHSLTPVDDRASGQRWSIIAHEQSMTSRWKISRTQSGGITIDNVEALDFILDRLDRIERKADAALDRVSRFETNLAKLNEVTEKLSHVVAKLAAVNMTNPTIDPAIGIMNPTANVTNPIVAITNPVVDVMNPIVGMTVNTQDKESKAPALQQGTKWYSFCLAKRLRPFRKQV